MSGSGPMRTAAVTPTEGLDRRPAGQRSRRTSWRDTLRSILRQRSAVVGLILLASLVLIAIFAPT